MVHRRDAMLTIVGAVNNGYLNGTWKIGSNSLDPS